MSDTLQASPRNESLFDLAQLLRKAPGKLAAANPVLGGLATAGKEFLTEPIARGLEHWAYGDRFLGPPANAPMVNERTEDMLSALPFGAAAQGTKGLTTAMLLGVGGRSSDEKVKKLVKLLRMGASPDEAWQDTGRALVPEHSSRLKPNLSDPEMHNYVREIPDEGLKTNPLTLYGADEKKLIVEGLPPIAQKTAQIRAENTNLFVPGKWKLRELIEHPELFAARPYAPDMPVNVNPRLNSFGSYNPNTRKIDLGTKSFLTGNAKGGTESTIMHELMHDEQHVFGMPGGGMPDEFVMSPTEQKRLANMWELNNTQLGRNNPEMQMTMFNMAKHRNSPFNIYDKLLGEQHARVVQDRLNMSRSLREEISPTSMYSDLEGGINPHYARMIMKLLREQSPMP